MVKPLFLSVSILAFAFANSQTYNASSIDTSFLKYETAEAALNLPASYKVVYCRVVFSTKNEIFVTEGSQWKSKNFYAFISKAKKGDELAISDIVVLKDGVKKKMGPKKFIF